jgi:hypothetical protein
LQGSLCEVKVDLFRRSGKDLNAGFLCEVWDEEIEGKKGHSSTEMENRSSGKGLNAGFLCEVWKKDNHFRFEKNADLSSKGKNAGKKDNHFRFENNADLSSVCERNADEGLYEINAELKGKNAGKKDNHFRFENNADLSSVCERNADEGLYEINAELKGKNAGKKDNHFRFENNIDLSSVYERNVDEGLYEINAELKGKKAGKKDNHFRFEKNADLSRVCERNVDEGLYEINAELKGKNAGKKDNHFRFENNIDLSSVYERNVDEKKLTQGFLCNVLDLHVNNNENSFQALQVYLKRKRSVRNDDGKLIFYSEQERGVLENRIEELYMRKVDQLFEGGMNWQDWKNRMKRCSKYNVQISKKKFRKKKQNSICERFRGDTFQLLKKLGGVSPQQKAEYRERNFFYPQGGRKIF